MRLTNVTQVHFSPRHNWGIASKLLISYWETSEISPCSPAESLKKEIPVRQFGELKQWSLRDRFETFLKRNYETIIRTRQYTQLLLTVRLNSVYFSGVTIEKDEKLVFGLDWCSFLTTSSKWYILDVSITILLCYGHELSQCLFLLLTCCHFWENVLEFTVFFIRVVGHLSEQLKLRNGVLITHYTIQLTF